MNSNDFKLFKLLHVMDQLELPSSALASRGWQVLCAGQRGLGVDILSERAAPTVQQVGEVP